MDNNRTGGRFSPPNEYCPECQSFHQPNDHESGRPGINWVGIAFCGLLAVVLITVAVHWVRG